MPGKTPLIFFIPCFPSKPTGRFIFSTTLKYNAIFIAHLIPGLCLVGVSYVGFNEILVNLLLSLALGFNGAATLSNLTNNQDLSPNYAGFLYGIMNTVGSISGMFISPMIEIIVSANVNFLFSLLFNIRSLQLDGIIH